MLINVHSKLYKYASKRKNRNKLQDNEWTFSPNLVRNKNQFLVDRPKSNKKHVNNLNKWKNELERKIEEKRNFNQQQEVSFDVKTGQKMFQPVTNNTNDTNPKRKDVFKYLYSLHSSRSKSKQKNQFTVDKDLNNEVRFTRIISYRIRNQASLE